MKQEPAAQAKKPERETKRDITADKEGIDTNKAMQNQRKALPLESIIKQYSTHPHPWSPHEAPEGLP
jgi:hypothetical protein